eukprot:CAMPEP_0181180202 /NCGR_PEP_ID=MMETSP1096-20121128/6670_1 /TAXON_ID=156174 ORGANISM="Chrysochromulina ericina, Strain CCMP281" /NCGR_SAMPLE_ID=MMETSP1096 /ASSEMBLY_ACC=CAM_ASM_000453 /LENGTH=239 /DNA_ID=CAMNT_0023268607 /DNA_START=45 /DNA_END=764 /DNA_ORIENTATION=-
MATSLLRSAAICQSAGMSGSNETVLCRDPNCAKSVEDLFSSTHRSEWRNVSKLLEDLRVPSFTRRLDAQDVISAVDEGERRVTEDIDMPSYFFRDGLYSLGQLSACMLRVKVKEEQLNLPISLAALSGNGSFSSYNQLYREKCSAEYSWGDYIIDRAWYYTGVESAQAQWEQGNQVAAAWILAPNLLLLLIIGHCVVTCARRGYCYRWCSPSSEEERESLNDDGANGDTKGTAMVSCSH